jgi:hypothetical protein
VPRRFDFWQTMLWLGPILAAIAPLLIVAQFGAFEHFSLIGTPVTLLESLGILGAICFPLAAFFFARMQIELEQVRLSRAWPTVTGTLYSIDVEERYVFRAGPRFVVTVSYGYDVGGRRYVGNTLTYAPRLLMGGDALQRLEQKYKAGGPVTVHHHPTDPADSVLETGEELAKQRYWNIFWLVASPLAVSVFVALLNATR